MSIAKQTMERYSDNLIFQNIHFEPRYIETVKGLNLSERNQAYYVQFCNALTYALFEANKYQWSDGLSWYEKASYEISQTAAEIGISFETFAAMVAVTSPGIIWEHNVRIAKEIAVNETFEDIGLPAGYGYQNYRKALTILFTDDYSCVRGLKVRNFWLTLLDNNHSLPVIDSWMIRLLRQQTIYSFTQNMFNVSALVFQKVAKYHNLSVANIQAIAWLFIRDSWKDSSILDRIRAKVHYKALTTSDKQRLYNGVLK